MSPDEAIEELRRAVYDPGPRPGYHYAMCAKMREEWPTLWHAIQNCILAASRPVEET